MTFEQLFKEQIKDNGHQVDRIQRNVDEIGLTQPEALRFDHAETRMIKAMMAGMGAAIDSLADEPRLQSLALIAFPHVLAKNLNMLEQFVDTVALMSVMQGQLTSFNEDKPDCDCANCRAGRAMSKIMVEADSADPQT